MKKNNLKRWLSVLLSAMVIVGTIKVPVFAKAADTSYDPAIAQEYSEESLLETSDQPGDEPDETAYSETDGSSAWELDDDTAVLTDGTVDESTASTALDAAETGTTENEAAPAPGELSDPDWEETDSYTSDSETAVEEGTDLDDQVTEEQESDNSDNQVTEEQERNNSDNQITEEQTETDYYNQDWNEEADYNDQPVENEENTNSSDELPEETDDSSVSDSVLLDNNSFNEINPDEADSKEEISDELILEESDSEEVGRRGTDTEYYSDETEFPYVDDFGNQGQTDIPNSITEENQEEAVSDEAYNDSATSNANSEDLNGGEIYDTEYTQEQAVGSFEDTLTWEIDLKKGVLTIGGSGAFTKDFWNQTADELRKIDVKHVILQDGITEIGDYAFSNTGICSIDIPDSVKKIGSYAFCSVGFMYSVAIPPHVTEIGEYAFGYEFDSDGKTVKKDYLGQRQTEHGSGEDVIFSIYGSSGTAAQQYADQNGFVFSSDNSGQCGENTFWTFDQRIDSLIIEGTGATWEFLTYPEEYSSPWMAFRNRIKHLVVEGDIDVNGGITYCWNLIEISLSDRAIISANNSPFGFENLETINISTNHEFYSLIDNFVVRKEGNCLLTCLPKASGTITIPEFVNSICRNAFMYCSNVTEIILPQTLDKIDWGAFSLCGVEMITIPFGVVTIEAYAFSGCRNLRWIKIPSSITTIEEYAFDGCTSIHRVNYAGTEESWSLVEVKPGNEELINSLGFTEPDFVDVRQAWKVTLDKPIGYMYTGKAIEPVVTVTEGTKVLELGADYSVSYKDNIELGHGTVVIVPSKPGYEEWIEETFVIKDTYTVTYDANGGFFFDRFSGEDIHSEKKETRKTREFAPGEEFYSPYTYVYSDNPHLMLGGWSLTKNGPALGTSYDDPNRYKVNSDMTVYAVWDKAYVLRLNANGGDFDTYLYMDWGFDQYFPYKDGISLQVGEGLSVSLPTPEESQYSIRNKDKSKIFAGWGLSPNGKNVAKPSSLADENSPTWNISDIYYKPQGDCTLYALWKDCYTIKLDTNGGGNYEVYLSLDKEDYTWTVNTLTMKCACGSPMSSADVDFSVFTNYEIFHSRYNLIPKDKNRKLLGWSTGRNGKPLNLDSYVPTKNCTLYAIWSTPINKVSVTGISAKKYTGNTIKQAVVLKNGTTTLKAGTDYKLTYKNNKNAGTATITITGIGTYTGSVSKSFKIGKAAQKISVKTSSSSIVAGKRATVSITGAKGKKSFTSSNTAIATVNKTTGVVTARKAGTVKITARSAATANYNAASKVVTIKVIPPTPQSLAASNQVKGLKLTWKKVTVGSGYEIQYSLNRNFSGVKKILVNKNATVNKVLTGLVKGKTYYFRIRTYKTVGKTKYYSVWSATKTVKVTK